MVEVSCDTESCSTSPSAITQAAFDENAQRFERARLHHHLEGLAQKIVADQHARLVAPDDARRLLAAAEIALVHHIVMEERGGVHELDRGRELQVMLARVAHHAGSRERQHRPDALSARIDEMRGDLGDQLHMALRMRQDRLVHPLHVGEREFHQRLDARPLLVARSFQRNHDSHGDYLHVFFRPG